MRILALAVGLLHLVVASAGEGRDAAIAAYLAAWNGEPDRLGDALGPDYLDRTFLLPLDAAAFKAQIELWRRQLPDLKVTLLERASGPTHEVLRLRYAGHPANPSGLVPLSGGPFELDQVEWLSLSDDRIVARQATPDDWTGPTELLFVPPSPLPLAPRPTQRIATFGAGAFPESVAVSPTGRVYVSTGFAGGIVTVDGAGKVEPFTALDVGPGGLMMCLAFDRDGTLYATANSRNPAVHGVWRFASDGEGARIAGLPPGSAPNGIALDGHRGLLVADSFGGVIWRVPLDGGEASVWLRHEWLLPRPLVGRFPGANGLQRSGRDVIVASSDRSLLIRVPILPDGSAGAPQIVASGMPADDFAVAPDGSLYVTTHPFNTVVRIATDGTRTVIAGPAQGVVGPTSAALAPDGTLLVAVDGGVYRPLPGHAPVASLVRIELAPSAGE